MGSPLLILAFRILREGELGGDSYDVVIGRHGMPSLVGL
jgi:hypothetical protein